VTEKLIKTAIIMKTIQHNRSIVLTWRWRQGWCAVSFIDDCAVYHYRSNAGNWVTRSSPNTHDTRSRNRRHTGKSTEVFRIHRLLDVTLLASLIFGAEMLIPDVQYEKPAPEIHLLGRRFWSASWV